MSAVPERLPESPIQPAPATPHFRVPQPATRLIRTYVSKAQFVYVHAVYSALLEIAVYQFTPNSKAVLTYTELAEAAGTSINMAKTCLKILQNLNLIKDDPGETQKEAHIFTISEIGTTNLALLEGMPSVIRRARSAPTDFTNRLNKGKREVSVSSSHDETSDFSPIFTVQQSLISSPHDETSVVTPEQNERFRHGVTKSLNVSSPHDEISNTFRHPMTKRPSENVDNKPIADPPKNRFKESYLKNLNPSSSDGLDLLKESIKDACMGLGFHESKITGIIATILNEKQRIRATNEQTADAVTRAKQVQGDFPTQNNPPGLFISNVKLVLAGEKIGKERFGDSTPKTTTISIMQPVAPEVAAAYTGPVIDTPLDLAPRDRLQGERPTTDQEQEIFLLCKEKCSYLPRMGGQMNILQRIKLTGVVQEETATKWVIEGFGLNKPYADVKTDQWLERLTKQAAERTGSPVTLELL